MNDDGALFPAPKPRRPRAGGPIYQGVARQFRELFPKTDDDAQRQKRELSGWLSLALAHARALDESQLPSVGRAQTSSELREALAYIGEAVTAGDEFDKFIKELHENTPATTPHPAV